MVGRLGFWGFVVASATAVVATAVVALVTRAVALDALPAFVSAVLAFDAAVPTAKRFVFCGNDDYDGRHNTLR